MFHLKRRDLACLTGTKTPPMIGIKSAIGLDTDDDSPENLKRPGFSKCKMQERV